MKVEKKKKMMMMIVKKGKNRTENAKSKHENKNTAITVHCVHMKTTWVLFEKVWLLTRFNGPLSVLYDKLIAFKCYRLSNRIFVIDEVSETTQTRIVRTEIMFKARNKKINKTKQNKILVCLFTRKPCSCMPVQIAMCA